MVLQRRVSDFFGVGGTLKTENTAPFLMFVLVAVVNRRAFILSQNASHTDGTVRVKAEYLLREGINMME